jgi:hypothetical protein
MRVTIASAFLLLLVATTAAADQRVENRFQAAALRGSASRVIIDIPTGDITVRNGPADRLVVTGTASRDPDGPRSRSKEQRIVNDTSVEIVVRNDEAIIKRKFGPDADSFRAQAFTRYEVVIEVPAGLHLDVKTHTGEVTIHGSFGDIDVDLRAGEIEARLPRRDVRELRASCRIGEVRTNIGNEIVEREGIFPGRTRYLNPEGKSFVTLHTTVGEVNVELTK